MHPDCDELAPEMDVLDEMVEGARAQFALLPRPISVTEPIAHGHAADLSPADVVCRLRSEGTGAWAEKKLDPVSWQHVGHGVYVLTIEAAEAPAGERFTFLVEGRAGLKPAIEPILRTVRVVPARARFVPGELPVTTLVGRLVGLDGRPRAKAPLTFRIHQPPLLSGGTAVTGEMITVETDASGAFSIDIVTGACVAIQIPQIGVSKILVVPPPPAPGIPVRLFSI